MRRNGTSNLWLEDEKSLTVGEDLLLLLDDELEEDDEDDAS
jgi:hypothetical protein